MCERDAQWASSERSVAIVAVVIVARRLEFSAQANPLALDALDALADDAQLKPGMGWAELIGLRCWKYLQTDCGASVPMWEQQQQHCALDSQAAQFETRVPWRLPRVDATIEIARVSSAAFGVATESATV